MSSRRIITGHKDYLEATSLLKSALIEGYERQDGREVSPLTWKDGEYVFTIRWPDGHGEVVLGAEAAADEDPAVAAWSAKAQRLDLPADRPQGRGQPPVAPARGLAGRAAAGPLPALRGAAHLRSPGHMAGQPSS